MKALVLRQYGQLVIEDLPRPTLGAQDALVRVMACGICGSDVHGMDGSTGRRQPPIVMGHEASGVIEELGEAVSAFTPGDRVTFDSTIYNPDSHFSRRGFPNLCDDRRVLGVSCDEYRRDGAFAELVAVPSHILYRLPPRMSFEQAALVEPAAVALHACRLTPLAAGDVAVVFGAGLIGLLVVQLLRLSPVAKVVAVDPDDDRLALARELGAQDCFNPGQGGVRAAVKALSNGRGADVAIEAVGVEASVRGAIDSVRKGGSVTLVGNLSPDVRLPLQSVVARQITLRGSCASSGEYPECLDLIATGRLNVDRLLSTTAPLAEGPSWFERLHRKERGLMKVVLRPNG